MIQEFEILKSEVHLYMIIYNNSLFEMNSQYYKLKKPINRLIINDQQQSGNLKIIKAIKPNISWWGLERCNCPSRVGIILREMSMMGRLVAGDNYPHRQVAHENSLPISPYFIEFKNTIRS